MYKRVCDFVCISLLLYIAFSVPLRAFLRLSRFYLEVVFPTKDQFHQDLIKNISCVLWRSWLLSWKPLFFSVICKSTSSNGKWYESHLAPQEPQRRRKWKPTKKFPSVNKQRWVLIKQRKEERYQSEWLSASLGVVRAFIFYKKSVQLNGESQKLPVGKCGTVIYAIWRRSERVRVKPVKSIRDSRSQYTQ